MSAVCGICSSGATASGSDGDGTWITYRSCEGRDGPVRIRGVIIGGALLAQQECRIDLARGVLTLGPLPDRPA